MVDESELIERSRAGDEDAFAEIVAAHADQVFGALRRFGLDADEADEVSQAVFVRAWRALPRFEGRSRLSTWLYRIAFNEAQRKLASRARPAATAGLRLPGNRDGHRRDDRDAEDPIARLPDDERRGPVAEALREEFDEVLDAALMELPDEWRMAVILRDLEGLSTAEAAEIAGVGEAALKSRLHRGRMQLRDLLQPYLAAA